MVVVVVVVLEQCLFLLIEGAKMVSTGVAAPSRVTQRKPLGVVNRMDCGPQGNAKEPVRAKTALTSTGKVPVGPAKPQSHSQLSHKPRPQLQEKAKLNTKVAPAAREQVRVKYAIFASSGEHFRRVATFI